VLYWGILRDLALQWWDDANYSHGFLVPIFTAFLLWRQRAQLTELRPHGSMLGLPILLTGIAALLLGDIGAENFLMRSSLIVILAGSTSACRGPVQPRCAVTKPRSSE
jgi:exosortase